MRNKKYAWGGLLLLGSAAAFAFPKVMSKGRLALRRATGNTYRSGVSNPHVRPSADPAAARPA